jgi:hypothetical protein
LKPTAVKLKPWGASFPEKAREKALDSSFRWNDEQGNVDVNVEMNYPLRPPFHSPLRDDLRAPG